MLKGNSKDITFEQLMAQAADVAKAQDAVLIEKAKERRKIEEAKKLKEDLAKKELERKQRELERKKMEIEQKQLKLQQEKQKKATLSNNNNNHIRKTSNSSSTNQQRQSANKALDSKSKTSVSKISKTKKNNIPIPVVPIIEKKKPVHMSYEQLMEKAKEVSQPKKSILPSTTITSSSSTTTSTRPIKDQDRSLLLMNKSNKDIKGPTRTNTSSPASSSPSVSSSLYVKRPIATVNKSKPKESSSNSALRTRDRIRLLHNTPLQQVQRVKRDRQSIEEIQRDIRHAKGKYSDDEDGADSLNRKKQRMMADQRLMKNNNSSNRPIGGGGVDRMNSKMRPSSSQRPLPPSQQRPLPPSQQRQPIKMPFRRVVDPRREIKHRNKYQDEDEDEDDEEMDEFIVDDDDEEVSMNHHYHNDYSSEISKLFRYDRSKYANESVYSDDDMEAGASEVLREEKRSERLARKEDEIEEKLEMERQQRKLAKAKRK